VIEHEPWCEGGHVAKWSCAEVTTLRKEQRRRDAANPKVPPDVSLELTQYERDNLLALLGAVVGRGGKSPFTTAHNGDWTLQVAYKLGYMGERTEWGRPNVAAEQIADNARAWRS
jgi:hypothetical protein